MYILLTPIFFCLTTAAPAAQSSPVTTGGVYKGVQVTASWVDQQYSYFKNRIANIDGKFRDIGKAVTEIELKRDFPDADTPAHLMTKNPPEVGDIRVSWFKVIQIVGENEALVRDDDVLFHVRGIDPAKQIDGTGWANVRLVYVGTYQYISVMGARRTIQSYLVYRPITREEFVSALAGGFELVRYTIVFKTRLVRGSSGRPLRLSDPQIVAEPVPTPPVPVVPEKSRPQAAGS
jgi:hypothetical protein